MYSTDRARKEAEYNLSLMNKMDTTLNENDQLYMDEVRTYLFFVYDTIKCHIEFDRLLPVD